MGLADLPKECMGRGKWPVLPVVLDLRESEAGDVVERVADVHGTS